MTSYKSRNNQRIKSSLARRIEPIQPSQDRYGEIKLQLDQLMDYSVDRIHYFPREHKWPAGLGYNIMKTLDYLFELIFEIVAYNPAYDREVGLRQMSVKLKVMSTYVRSSYTNRLINAQKWEVWTRQIVDIDNQVIAMAMYLQRRHEKSKD